MHAKKFNSCTSVITSHSDLSVLTVHVMPAQLIPDQFSDSPQLKIPLNQFYPYIRCGLCCGFLIDASTITECLHTCE